MSVDSTESRALRVDLLLATMPCRTSDEARHLIGFAYQCVLGTPLEGNTTPLALLDGQPALQDCFWLVGQWLSGWDVAAQLEGAEDLSFRSAVAAAGMFRKDVAGAGAACWAVAWLVQSAVAVAGASRRLAQVPTTAGLVARLARRADEGGSEGGVSFQEGLAQDFFVRPRAGVQVV